ncbi:MAG: hypothetical protein FJW30_25495 [Acidobacteria bacterium]|nr:hypothetical protein [Acidobacteriota bacterium]
MERPILGADHQAGAVVRHLRLFGGEMFDDAAAEQTAADNAIAFVLELRFERYVVAVGHRSSL